MSDRSDQTTKCATCQDSGKVLAMWERPGGPPGNGYVGCPDCPAGHTYNEAIKREVEEALSKANSNWPNSGWWRGD